VLKASGVSKSYPAPEGEVSVLSDVSLTFEPGDAAAIMGPSGTGKSTLLYILGALEPPTRGSIALDGTDPYALSPKALATFRNRRSDSS
jgi:ABC-type lipoprotein export system ATPase subunit